MTRRRRAAFAVCGIGTVVLAAAAWGGVALASSGGGYNPNQQDCPWNANAQDAGTTNTGAPPASVPGCHNVALNVETGGTTNGDPNSGNTRFVEFGNNQSPNNSYVNGQSQGESYQSFGLLFYLGDPGAARASHSGCIAANTDGTNGGTGTGCGNNKNGAGFILNYDYYEFYCPVADRALANTGGSSDATGLIGTINQNTNPGGQLPGSVLLPVLYSCQTATSKSKLTVDHGTDTKLQDVLTQGLIVYMGADDNLDNGEHDGFTCIDGTCYDQYPNSATNAPAGQAYQCASGGATNGPPTAAP